MHDFADRLKCDREAAGLTVRQLAQVSGISFSYITKIEKGRYSSGISPAIIQALAKSLEADDLEYLYLSGVVPSPLNSLIAEEKSRYFVRKLLETSPTDAAWESLQAALPPVRPGKKNGSRKTVA